MTAPAHSARSRFAAVMAQPDARIDLAQAALLVAAEEYPQLAVEPYLRRLDSLAERVRDRLANEEAPLVVLQELNRVLFEEEGLSGNDEAYYDPRNSFLNDVLDRRLGIPITLSIVQLEVGWRLGLPLAGISFPSHFLVRFEGESTTLLVDPYDGGRIRFQDEAQAMLDRSYGGMVRLKPEFIEPTPRRDIVSRLLRNLKSIYLNARDDRRALTVIERLLVVQPDEAQELRDRGIMLARIGRFEEAIAELERYLDFAPGASDAGRVREYILRLSEAV